MSFTIQPHILPPTSKSTTNFSLLPQDFHKRPPSSVGLLPWKFPPTSMEVNSLEVSESRFTSKEISMQVGGSRLTSMEVHGSFYGSTWKCPLSVEVQTDIASINCKLRLLPSIAICSVEASMSFDIPLHTSIYSHDITNIQLLPQG